MMSTTANLAIMHGKPVSRSWSSIRRDNNEDKAPTESVTKNRTVRSYHSLLPALNLGLNILKAVDFLGLWP